MCIGILSNAASIYALSLIFICLSYCIGKLLLAPLLKKDSLIAYLLYGVVTISSLFGTYFFKFRTISSLILAFILLNLFFHFRKIRGPKINFYRELLPQILLFTFLYLLRFFSLFDFGSQTIHFFAKDDFLYSINIALLNLLKIENTGYMLSRQAFQLSTAYIPYHYLSFGSSLILKNISGVSAYFIAVLHMTTMFQLFAVTGIYSVISQRLKNPWLILLLTSLIITTLRYNYWDDIIFQNTLLFQNFAGNNLLFSGYWIKFCLGLGVLCLAICHIEQGSVLSKSFFLVFLNPLLLPISSVLVAVAGLWKPRKIGWICFFSLLAIGTYLGFNQTMGQYKSVLDLNAVQVAFRLSVYEFGKRILFIRIPNLFIHYYNVLLIPFGLYLWRGSWLKIKLLLFFFFLYPFFSDTSYSKYFLLLMVLALWWAAPILLRSITTTFFSIALVVIIFFEDFFNALPEFEQSHWILTYGLPYAMAAFVFTRLDLVWKYWLIPISFYLLHNLYIYKNEFLFRSYKLCSFEYLNAVCAKLQPASKPHGFGYINREVTGKTIGESVLGEEVCICSDTYFPTIVSKTINLPIEDRYQGYSKLKQPRIDKENHLAELTDSSFARKLGLNPILVKDGSREISKWAFRNATDSISNIYQGYTLYYLAPSFFKPDN